MRKIKIIIDFSKNKYLLLLSIISIVFATSLLLLAYRHIDMSFNLFFLIFFLKYQYNVNINLENLCDKHMFSDNCFKVDELYELGLKDLFFAFLLYILSFIFLFIYAFSEKHEHNTRTKRISK